MAGKNGVLHELLKTLHRQQAKVKLIGSSDALSLKREIVALVHLQRVTEGGEDMPHARRHGAGGGSGEVKANVLAQDSRRPANFW